MSSKDFTKGNLEDLICAEGQWWKRWDSGKHSDKKKKNTVKSEWALTLQNNTNDVLFMTLRWNGTEK